MLESLHLKKVGPASRLDLDLAPRLNLITGDNGLGKSFLLDVAWWALTRTWARGLVLPRNDASPGAKAEIGYSYSKKTQKKAPEPYGFTSTFDSRTGKWSVRKARPAIPGLVLYAQVDGGFSVWDPARNYWTEDAPDRPNAYLFTAEEVWNGNAYCEGLVRDLASWQREQSEAFAMWRHVLETLSPSREERLTMGDLRKLTVSDPKRYPTLRMPYGEDVPVINASAGMRRILALAYLLVWAWQEHLAAAAVRGEEPAREVIFLIDEIEAHLHPQWQRRIVPAVLNVMEALSGGGGSRVQLVTASHSPLVLASAEPLFDDKKDAWFDIDLEEGSVVLRKREFMRLGEVSNWLTSEAFDLREARSLESETAIREALALAKQPAPARSEMERIDALLRGSLGDVDPFWLRWEAFRDRQIEGS